MYYSKYHPINLNKCDIFTDLLDHFNNMPRPICHI